jgi:hypothetical protein
MGNTCKSARTNDSTIRAVVVQPIPITATKPNEEIESSVTTKYSQSVDDTTIVKIQEQV